MSTYPNQFARIGIPDAAVLSRLSDCFSTIFFSPENNFYHQHPTDPDAACMVDTGNNDARTEGMSYGMMMCVQMNRKDLFDKLSRTSPGRTAQLSSSRYFFADMK